MSPRWGSNAKVQLNYKHCVPTGLFDYRYRAFSPGGVKYVSRLANRNLSR